MVVSTPTSAVLRPEVGIPVFSVVIVAPESPSIRELALRLQDEGLACSIIPDKDRALERLKEKPAHLVLLDIEAVGDGHLPSEFLAAAGRERPALMAIVSPGNLSNIATEAELADFVIMPFSVDEAAVRVKRALRQKASTEGGDVIVFGPLSIDKASCEVRLDGDLVEMTFKEYELLLFLIKNRGRVFSRQVLLDRVWGHDYYGGDRTVDVHIRRLRSKIESSGHSFIETVRNVGYKFIRDI